MKQDPSTSRFTLLGIKNSHIGHFAHVPLVQRLVVKELADAYHHELTWIMITNGERTHAKARPAVRREFDVRCNLQR